MSFRLSWLWGWTKPAPRTAPVVEKPRVRPTLEALEDRTVPTTIPLQFAGVIPQGGGNFLAVAQVGVNPVVVPGSLTPDASNSQILDLHLNPIHLNLLGLHLDTSAICLDITTTGSGLLGQLLGQLAGSGNNGNGNGNGNGLGGLNQLAGPLLNLILNLEANTITSSLTTNPSPSQPSSNTTNILNLELGPLNLNLLGLNVHLDNCADGPITVDLTAQSGSGNLLGNLLTSLANALNPSQQQLLGQAATTILTIV